MNKKSKKIVKCIILYIIYIIMLVLACRSGLAAKIWDYIFIIY